MCDCTLSVTPSVVLDCPALCKVNTDMTDAVIAAILGILLLIVGQLLHGQTSLAALMP